MKLKLCLLTLFAWGISFSAVHAQELELGKVGIGGSGCLQGSSEVTLDQEALTLNISTANYKLTVGKKSLSRKSCMFAIPLNVPQGKKLVILKSEILGKLQLKDKKMSAEFNLETFFIGKSGDNSKNSWNGPNTSDFHLENQISKNAPLTTQCGEKTVLRLNSSLMLKNKGKLTSAAIELKDEETSILIQLALKDC